MKTVLAYIAALHSYIVSPLAGAIRKHVNVKEFADAVIAALAAGGGFANILPYLAAHLPDFIHGVDPFTMTTLVTALTFAARLVQRFFQGDQPTPAPAKLAAAPPPAGYGIRFNRDTESYERVG